MNLEKLQKLSLNEHDLWRILNSQGNNSYKCSSTTLVMDIFACQRIEMETEKWIKHYSSKHKILLVGEGDFSFAACLGRSLGSAGNIVATSLDSKEMLIKYTGAYANVKELEELGCKIIHKVDCCTMSQHADLKYNFFDRIVFNFPHAGFFSCREHVPHVIQLHKDLVKGFLKNAVEMLRENGEVHITHKTSHPFDRWGIKELANEVGLGLFEEVPFYIWQYPGYVNKRGDGSRLNESFPIGACSTFKFKIKDCSHLQV